MSEIRALIVRMATAPDRLKKTTWTECLKEQWDVLAAADFFTASCAKTRSRPERADRRIRRSQRVCYGRRRCPLACGGGPVVSHRKTSVQLQSTNAQTPAKTEEYQRPESKTIQQDREPMEICKTSTPGSNPGGASNHKSN